MWGDKGDKEVTEEESRERTRSNYAAQMEMLGCDASGNPLDMVHVVRCRDCKYFEVKDCWADFGKVPILVSDVPTCHKWGDGECKTSPDGYCFLGERR